MDNIEEKIQEPVMQSELIETSTEATMEFGTNKDSLLSTPMVEESTIKVSAIQEETPTTRNFKALSESKRKVEKERDEAVARLRDFESRSKAPQPVEPDYSDDPDANYKRVLEDQQQLRLQVMAQNAELKLRQKYPDFEQVVSPDNIAILRETEPEIAESIGSQSDIFSKAVAAYKAIKKFGIYEETTVVQNRETISKNLSKPRPAASVSPSTGNNPLSKANAFATVLTEERKAQLYKEMVEASKRI